MARSPLKIRHRGEWLRDLDIEIPPMPESEKLAIKAKVESLGVRLDFANED